MENSDEIRKRVFESADHLYKKSNNKIVPTVDAVRKQSKTNMNDASLCMREWRNSLSERDIPIVQNLPEKLQKVAIQAMSSVWHESQKISYESLTAAKSEWEAERAQGESMRVELSTSYDECSTQLEEALARISELEKLLDQSRAEVAAIQVKLTISSDKLSDALKQTDKANTERDSAKDEASFLQGQLEASRSDQAKLFARITPEK